MSAFDPGSFFLSIDSDAEYLLKALQGFQSHGITAYAIGIQASTVKHDAVPSWLDLHSSRTSLRTAILVIPPVFLALRRKPRLHLSFAA